MNKFLKTYLVENFGLAADADDATAKSLAKEKIGSGELELEKYIELLAKKEATPQDKASELADTIATKTSEAVVSGLSKSFDDLGTVIKSALTPAPAPTPEPTPDPEPVEEKGLSYEEIEAKLFERVQKEFTPKNNDGGDALKVWKMAYQDDQDAGTIRVKSAIEAYRHDPTAMTYKKSRSKLLGIDGQPMHVTYQNGGMKEVDVPTERIKMMCAVWLKFQLFPERLNEKETEIVQYILHKEKFHVPGREDAVLLDESQRMDVWAGHKNFYRGGHTKANLIDDSTSGGEDSVPEFFDMAMIVSPTLAEENIPSYCNVVMVPRGSAAQNFIVGRPTIAAANTEGSATSVYDATGFITNHDTSFFRAAGFLKIGKNYAEDAHPQLVTEIMNQYNNSVKLWLNEQIMTGDGTTEPQGITVDTGTGDITPGTPTTGPLTLADALNMLFGVSKAYRENGGRNNAIYCMTDSTYKRFRSIATGVTGDTRLVFGDDVESYQLFGHPVLIEEGGMTNADVVFAQMKGYRLYQRQGARFIREDRGDTLTRDNTFLVGVDVRYGGQLDEPNYASVMNAAPTS